MAYRHMLLTCIDLAPTVKEKAKLYIDKAQSEITSAQDTLKKYTSEAEQDYTSCRGNSDNFPPWNVWLKESEWGKKIDDQRSRLDELIAQNEHLLMQQHADYHKSILTSALPQTLSDEKPRAT